MALHCIQMNYSIRHCSLSFRSLLVFQYQYRILVKKRNYNPFANIFCSRLNSDILTSASIIVPDIAAFVVCLLVFISCRLLLRKQPISSDSAKPFTSRLWPPRCCPMLFDYFAKFVTLVFMTLAGILHPSIVASVYFLFVLLSVTVWSVFICLRQCWFQRLRFVLLVYAGLHLVTLYVVQFHYAQSIWMTYVERNGTTER